MSENKLSLKPQNITLQDRERLNITGVNNVDSYNDTTIILSTIKGGLNIKGENLNISKLNLDDGSLKISGTINSLTYISKEGAPKNLLERLFK
ncbi:sporulation protein YabP [Tissierella creatinophila]|uniref:Spore protein YabP n=1 Tax=Tissierella creatinophila DSM 6911 TaxID=1123403 RepID=A0A1U7M6S9_TISCR|nr:sporulation protein YabP [Tissierella creatinophila]OLS03007.1 spore protein YabP [Tissierella creatinophila DSM 6911]